MVDEAGFGDGSVGERVPNPSLLSQLILAGEWGLEAVRGKEWDLERGRERFERERDGRMRRGREAERLAATVGRRRSIFGGGVG